jgi:hypothetical protein
MCSLIPTDLIPVGMEVFTRKRISIMQIGFYFILFTDTVDIIQGVCFLPSR